MPKSESIRDRSTGPRAQDSEETRAWPRPFWSGSLAFGLVGIPVSLHVASRPGGATLHLVDAAGTPLIRRWFCSAETDRPLAPDELVRGFEVEPGRFVTVADEELAALAPEQSGEIALRRFVPRSQLDPVYFERAYLLAPERGAARAYRLLARTLEETGRAGIATVVMRGKEYLVAILGAGGLLRAETLRFHDTVRTPAELGLPPPERPDAALLATMERAMETLSGAELDRQVLSDREAQRVRDLVQKKLVTGTDVLAAPPELAPESSPESLPETGEISEEDAAPEDGQDTPGTPLVDLVQIVKQTLGEPEAETGPEAGAGSRAEREEVPSADAVPQPESESEPARPAPRLPRRPPRLPGQPPRPARSRPREARDPTKHELYERARELGIPGRSAMTKEQLIEALRGSG